MTDTHVRVKKWRNYWAVECWGLQHSLSASKDRALESAAAMCRALLAKGEIARLVVEDAASEMPETGRNRAA